MKKGSKHKESSKRKIALSRLGKSYPRTFTHPNTLKTLKQFAFKKGCIPHNKGKKSRKETCDKISKYAKTRTGEKTPFFGRRHSEKSIKLMKDAHTGIIPNDITRKKMSLSHTGRKHKESTKKLLSDQRKGIPRPQHVREALLKANIGRICKPETRLKMSIARTGLKRSENYKQLMREKRKDWKIPFYDTKPERMMQFALMLNGIKFEKHKPIKIGQSWHQVDIFIEPNIVVEIDGVHWHIEPEDIKRDLEQTQELTLMGYHVIRIRDKDILKNIQSCAENVLSLIKDLNTYPIPKYG